MASSATGRHVADKEEVDSTKTVGESPRDEQGQTNEYRQDATLTEDKKYGEKKEKKPSKFKAAWDKLGLDASTLMMMGKAALPPTIAPGDVSGDGRCANVYHLRLPNGYYQYPRILHHATREVHPDDDVEHIGDMYWFGSCHAHGLDGSKS
jgi:hypothetical protein